MKLTDTTCKNAKPAEKPRKLSDGHGMYLEVMPNGSKYWRLKYRFAGKEKRLAIGVYPQVSLKEAREKRETARKLLAEGIDPNQAKRVAKAKSRISAENTFEAIAREWHDNQKSGWSENHAQTVLARLEQDIFPELGRYPITDIDAPTLLSTIRRIEARGAHEIARRQVQVCGQVFRYGIQTGRADRDPSHDLRGALKPVKKSHYAALDSRELPGFLQELEQNNARLYMQTRHAVKLLLYTFVRTSELINAKWDEFDLEGRQWTIPAQRMKMRKEHIVPLSKQAVALLKELQEMNGHRAHVFPNQVTPRKSMSNNTILKAIERMGYKGRTTGHGFRALAMTTIKEQLQYRHEVIDRQLAHAPRNKVDAAYDRAAFLNERRKMMQEWADYVDALATGGNVLKMHTERVG